MAEVDVFITLYVLAALSIVCSVASMFIVLWVWHKQPSSKESPSFNLTLWIALADLPLRVNDFLSNPMTFKGDYPSEASFARFVMWLNFFSSYWYIYLNCMITLDLQLVFFHRLPRQARIRRWYPLLGTAIAFFLAFWYLLLPNPRVTPNGMLVVGEPKSFAPRFVIVWSNIWMHVGIAYSLIVVIAVCVKVFRSQSRLRRFNQNEPPSAASRALIRNTRLILAYPAVLFIVYVPYVLNTWFSSYLTGSFPYYWNIAYSIIYASQGIFNFIILLFHPVMLSTYRQNTFGFSSLWSRFASYRWGMRSDPNMTTAHSFSGSQVPLTHNAASGDPTNTAPLIRTMDMGPGVTGYFDGALNINATDTAPNQKLSGLACLEPLTTNTTDPEKGGMDADLEDHTWL
ncbi:hypothetical protein H4R34_000419 [Dimargaris verticillata]|uniref:Uncharacterized protein n=1 Tax=Dimargaris verticillata TaxID=2761393 RepID=A0A9W8BDA8_9FUNG|nr:hypothetical protein H4R34_000419 [Dimargaris verticillata]